MEIDALFIDFYGTISAGDRAAVLNSAREVVESLNLDLSPEDFAVKWGNEFFKTIENANHDRFQTLHECEVSSLRRTVQDVRPGVALDPEPFVDRLDEYWRRPPLHVEVLEFLKALHVPVCCISNADNGPLLEAIDHHGLQFDAIVTSQDVRCYKPEPAIFEQAIRRMNVSPGNCMHVGDSLHSDIAGAGGVGLRTAWVCRDDRIHDVGNETPQLVVESLVELPFWRP